MTERERRLSMWKGAGTIRDRGIHSSTVRRALQYSIFPTLRVRNTRGKGGFWCSRNSDLQSQRERAKWGDDIPCFECFSRNTQIACYLVWTPPGVRQYSIMRGGVENWKVPGTVSKNKHWTVSKMALHNFQIQIDFKNKTFETTTGLSVHQVRLREMNAASRNNGLYEEKCRRGYSEREGVE